MMPARRPRKSLNTSSGVRTFGKMGGEPDSSIAAVRPHHDRPTGAAEAAEARLGFRPKRPPRRRRRWWAAVVGAERNRGKRIRNSEPGEGKLRCYSNFGEGVGDW